MTPAVYGFFRSWKSSWSAGEVTRLSRVDTFAAHQVRCVLDIIHPRGTAPAAEGMIYSGAGNTQNKDAPTEHKPNYERAECHCPGLNARPSSCVAYVISSLGLCTENKRLKIARPLRVATRIEGEESRIARWIMRLVISAPQRASYQLRTRVTQTASFSLVAVDCVTTSVWWSFDLDVAIHVVIGDNFYINLFLFELWRGWYICILITYLIRCFRDKLRVLAAANEFCAI